MGSTSSGGGEEFTRVDAGGGLTHAGIAWRNLQLGNGVVTRTFQAVGATLLTDQKCLDWLSKNASGGRGNRSQLEHNELVRNIVYSLGKASATGTAKLGVGAQQVTNTFVGSAPIVFLFNTSSAFFVRGPGHLFGSSPGISGINAGTDRFRAAIALHEVAHLFRADGFKSNDGDEGTVSWNNDVLYDSCSKTINAASN